MSRKKIKMPHRHVSIDAYAWKSGLKDWNVTWKVIFALTALIAVIAADNPAFSLMTMAFMGILTCFEGKVKVGDYGRLMLVPVTFILMSGMAILIQFGSGAGNMWAMPFFGTHLYITEGSVKQSLSLSAKAFGAVSCLYFLTLSSPMGEILSVLRKMHVPNLILELMHFIYRYIFILLEMNRKQKEAVKSRLGYCDRKTAFHTFGCEMANLLVVSLNRSREYYDALESRGYDGDCLFWEEEKKITKAQIGWMLLYAAAAVLVWLLQH